MAYDSNSIKVKTQRDHVRMRTGMYLGGTIHNTALREVFDNSVDEIVAGYGDNVRVRFYDDGSMEVTDSGRGVPVDMDDEGVSGIEKALGNLNSGGKFDQDSYSSGTQAGLNGVGSSATNMISLRFSVRVYRGGKEYSLDFREGLPGHFAGKDYDAEAKFTEAHDVIVHKDTRSEEDKKLFPTGTSIRLTFDPKVATDDVFDKEEFLERIRYYPYLIKNLVLIVEDGDSHEVVDGDGGLVNMLNLTLPPEKIVGEDILHIQGKTAIRRIRGDEEITVPIDYEVVIGWEEKGYDQHRVSFVNSVKTEKGVHESSLDSALESAFSSKIQSMKILKNKEDPPTLSDILEGAHVIVSVEMAEPPFEGQDKHSLRGRDIYNALRVAYEESIKKWLGAKANAPVVAAIADKAVRASRVREMQTIAKSNARKKANKEGSTLSMPTKFLACSDKENNELYICEGDSALSTVKASRDSKTQAALPIRGKILNTFGLSIPAALKNNEINDIVQVIGAGIGKEFDLEKMNFDRIVIATDADYDGNHISSLLLTLFWTLMRPLVEDGRLFIALPPLFVISEKKKGGKIHYALDKAERDIIVQKLRSRGVRYETIRAKGLGEMSPEEFWDTVLNPETRAIKRVQLEDIEESGDVLNLLFSKTTDNRKLWLERERVNYDIDDFDL